jgi:hypothetical protein
VISITETNTISDLYLDLQNACQGCLFFFGSGEVISDSTNVGISATSVIGTRTVTGVVAMLDSAREVIVEVVGIDSSATTGIVVPIVPSVFIPATIGVSGINMSDSEISSYSGSGSSTTSSNENVLYSFPCSPLCATLK